MDLVHPQLSKLLKSITYGRLQTRPSKQERRRNQNGAAIEMDKHSHVPVADFLLLFHAALLKSSEGKQKPFGECLPFFAVKPRRCGDKSCRRAFHSGVSVDSTLEGSPQPCQSLKLVNKIIAGVHSTS